MGTLTSKTSGETQQQMPKSWKYGGNIEQQHPGFPWFQHSLGVSKKKGNLGEGNVLDNGEHHGIQLEKNRL